MVMKYAGLMVGVLLSVALSAGCGEMGKVDQGRVVEYDKAKEKVTIIRDMKADSKSSDYSHLPPIVYELPKDPSEMGPEPKAGKRMKLDIDKKEIVIFESATKTFRTIPYTLIDRKADVVQESDLVQGKKFPLVDKTKKTITIYSRRQKTLETFTVPEEFFALPEDTWDAGDEVRIYYKEEGKARRFMNITKTDIFKK